MNGLCHRIGRTLGDGLGRCRRFSGLSRCRRCGGRLLRGTLGARARRCVQPSTTLAAEVSPFENWFTTLAASHREDTVARPPISSGTQPRADELVTRALAEQEPTAPPINSGLGLSAQ